jgi:hypothetical protein
MTLLRPTVATATAVSAPQVSLASSAFSVQAAVNRPTHGGASPRLRANSASTISESAQRNDRGTCRFMMTRNLPKPPPTTADERTVNGSSARTHNRLRIDRDGDARDHRYSGPQYLSCTPARKLTPSAGKPSVSI